MQTQQTRELIERPIREACQRADFEGAARSALHLYGRELLGYLIARLGEQRGNDLFSEWLEDFWRGLPSFAWRCTLRGWLYTLARHAIVHEFRGVKRRCETGFQTGAVFEVVAAIRTETALHLQTAMKSRLRELRERLSDDEQTLLILRVDRDLSWRELAAVMSEQGESTCEQDLDRMATRLRQRFQSAKARLRQLAEDEGLLPLTPDEC
jgi:RNA polymerase sigma-70 factor (ECF subfamily)